MATKNRIIYLMQYLQENSDENRSVTTAQIREEMAKKGCPIIISTLRDDIESLQSAGYDIQVNETEGMPTTYSWLDREWSLPELQILVDAVSSSQFITTEKSRELIDKLVRIGTLSRPPGISKATLSFSAIATSVKALLAEHRCIIHMIFIKKKIAS